MRSYKYHIWYQLGDDGNLMILEKSVIYRGKLDFSPGVPAVRISLACLTTPGLPILPFAAGMPGKLKALMYQF